MSTTVAVTGRRRRDRHAGSTEKAVRASSTLAPKLVKSQRGAGNQILRCPHSDPPPPTWGICRPRPATRIWRSRDCQAGPSSTRRSCDMSFLRPRRPVDMRLELDRGANDWEATGVRPHGESPAQAGFSRSSARQRMSGWPRCQPSADAPVLRGDPGRPPGVSCLRAAALGIHAAICAWYPSGRVAIRLNADPAFPAEMA
jgi:hypothetical protein